MEIIITFWSLILGNIFIFFITFLITENEEKIAIVIFPTFFISVFILTLVCLINN